ncbi:hypothetical protein [Flavobacterium olei]|uniref:hypothetical protein n=1 Tax=Flavobacterium olei TaxID=1886782 RepID=UPI003218FF0E
MIYEEALIEKLNYPELTNTRGKIMKVFLIPELPGDFRKYLLDFAYKDFDDTIVIRYSSNKRYKLFYRELKICGPA